MKNVICKFLQSHDYLKCDDAFIFIVERLKYKMSVEVSV